MTPNNYMNGEERMCVWMTFIIAAALAVTLVVNMNVGLERARITAGYEERLVTTGPGFYRTIWVKAEGVKNEQVR